MVWRRWVLVLVVVLAMVMPAVAVSALQTPQYQATGQILLGQPELDENFNFEAPALTEIQVNNLVAILTGSVVAQQARQQGGTSALTAVPGSATSVVSLVARDTDPQRAVTTIGAYVQAFSDYLAQQDRQALESAIAGLEESIAQIQGAANSTVPTEQVARDDQLASLEVQLTRVRAQLGGVDSGVVTIVDPEVPSTPFSPTPVRNGLLALVLGLALGISLAILLETMKRKPADNLADEADPESPEWRGVPDRGYSRSSDVDQVRAVPPDPSAAETTQLPARTATSSGAATSGPVVVTARRPPRPFPSSAYPAEAGRPTTRYPAEPGSR